MKYVFYIMTGYLGFTSIMNMINNMEWQVWGVGSIVMMGMTLLSVQIEKLQKDYNRKEDNTKTV